MKSKKTIAVTGASGYIGLGIIKKALSKEEYNVLAVSSRLEKIIDEVDDGYHIKFIENKNVNSHTYNGVDILIHCAFSRRDCKSADIASSLDYARITYENAIKNNVPFIINISSQGVYGNTRGSRNELTPAAPTMPYTMAKYASEVILATSCKGSNTHYTNLRLDSIAGNQKITHSLVEQGINKGVINIVGGEQVFSFLDVNDAINAILTATEIVPKDSDTIYNIGWNEKRYKITQLAEIAAETVEKHTGKKPIIHLEKRDIDLFTGMNTERFTNKTGWLPKKDIKAIFEEICCSKLS